MLASFEISGLLIFLQGFEGDGGPKIQVLEGVGAEEADGPHGQPLVPRVPPGRFESGEDDSLSEEADDSVPEDGIQQDIQELLTAKGV